jgi:DNA modification methylase
MSVADQVIADNYALYNGDVLEVITKIPTASVHLSLYSPPFVGLYRYSSSERDMSNCRSYEEFMEHYSFLVAELSRVAVPGRITAVHCTDIPSGNTGHDHMRDFPGDIVRLHEAHGWDYVARYAVWKDPFIVYLRTLAKSLRHRTMVEDSSRCSCAAADYLVVFRRQGENRVPIDHPTGLMNYIGAREVPADLLKYKGHRGKQTENKYSQWVWRQYASAFWDDVRLDRVLPYVDAKDPDDERHVHALQLDVIERAIILWSNLGDTVFTPFMGVGSEVYGALANGRRGVGVELKASYYRQSVLNVKAAAEIGARMETDAKMASAQLSLLSDTA